VVVFGAQRLYFSVSAALKKSSRGIVVEVCPANRPTGRYVRAAQGRQGADVGTQYRSVIFYHNTSQKKIAEEAIGELQEYFEEPIVTEVSPLINYFEAEQDHQNFYNLHSSQGYCQYVISPKLAKLRAHFASFLKE
jgi:hypothetical protein